MRPHVTVNCAMTADGKLAGRRRKQVTISSPEDLARVKELKIGVDAILVGIGTVLSDDPHLTVKGAPIEENPIRVVLDSRGRTPDDARVLNARARTIIATVEGCDKVWRNAEVLRIGKDRVDLDLLLTRLHEMGVRTMLVEGGGEVLWSFFKEGFVDHYSVFVGSKIIGGRTAPTPVDGEGFDDQEILNLKLVGCEWLGDGVLLEYEVCNDD
ncbi:MAG TPA: 2,5-diamino-6-(ribosylamino)-4(3H)-pyrimidinone 5'-phosphate reductase [Methanomassiliicoccales archaeon]|nr:2,5-diamino-6-(ribosylamino)-4(3H)-pyrimidinone 5'-phosphate reductase [Methanomassiliicoccales archaeon]